MRAVAALVVLLAATAARGDEEDGARETMRKALAHSLLGFDHARLVVALAVKTSASDPGETREIVVRTRRRADGLDRVLCFMSPADVRNTTFLSVSSNGGARAEQYLWLPELGRVRQVSRAAGNEPFLGTAFSYRDVEGWNLDDASYRRLPDERVGEHDCQVIEAVMKPAAGSEYARVVSFVRKSDYMPLRVQFFDAAAHPVKTLFTRRVDLQPGSGLAYARSVKMEDLRSGASTVLDITQADFAADLDAAMFTPDQLRRGVDCAP